MKRLIPVFLFIFIAVVSFGGILNFAKHQEQLKTQRNNQAETISIMTDIQSDIIEKLGVIFYEQSGIQIKIIPLDKEAIVSGKSGSADIYLSSQQNLSFLKKNIFNFLPIKKVRFKRTFFSSKIIQHCT